MKFQNEVASQTSEATQLGIQRESTSTEKSETPAIKLGPPLPLTPFPHPPTNK